MRNLEIRVEILVLKSVPNIKIRTMARFRYVRERKRVPINFLLYKALPIANSKYQVCTENTSNRTVLFIL